MSLAQRIEERWERDRAYLREHEPGLTLTIGYEHEPAWIKGSMTVWRGDGRAETLKIRITYPEADPFALPDVYDVDRCFERHEDRHVEPDGRFCMWLPVAAPDAAFRASDGLVLLLAWVREFAALQFRYEARLRRGITPAWDAGEWGHGGDGYDQWARETVGDLPADELRAVLGLVRRPPKKSGRCRCGSGRRYGNCHKATVQALRAAWHDPGATTALVRLLEEKERDVAA